MGPKTFWGFREMGPRSGKGPISQKVIAIVLIQKNKLLVFPRNLLEFAVWPYTFCTLSYKISGFLNNYQVGTVKVTITNAIGFRWWGRGGEALVPNYRYM